MISRDRLLEALDYDPDTGAFKWKAPSSRRVRVGDVAGNLCSNGYLRVCIDKREYLLHRLAWLYVHGEIPPCEIDHINRIRTDNRIKNLRPADANENRANATIRRDNKSGTKGVSWNSRKGRWYASICFRGVRRFVGSFEILSDAEAVMVRVRKEVHGEFSTGGDVPQQPKE